MRSSPERRAVRATFLLGLVLAASARAEETPELLAPKAFRAAVEKVLPSVVTIETFGTVAASTAPATRPARPARPPRRGAPGGISKPGEGPTTGLIVSADGLILTSTYNFVRNQPVITVVLADKTQHVARLLGRDDTRKLCLLKIDGVKDLPVPAAVPPRDVQIGQWAISVGYGYGGEEAAISAGIISATGRMQRRALQTDANLSPANYGGPLVDIDGRVLGVCVPLAPRSTDARSGTEWYDSGIGFAIPLHGLDPLLKRMAAGESIRQGYLGIRPAAEGRPEGGLAIDLVHPNSPAAAAGLQKGEIILRINEQPVNDTLALASVLNTLAPGDTVTLTIQRGTEKRTVSIKLATSPPPVPPTTTTAPATLPTSRREPHLPLPQPLPVSK